SDAGYGASKDAVADAVIEDLARLSDAFGRVADGDVRSVLRESGKRARDLASESMAGIRLSLGITSP
ncbi:MAG: hypothetical protein R6W79_01945, partial [Acidimicrobiia bacterium]